MPSRIILPLILGMLVLPVFPQDEPRPTTGDTSEVSDNIADLITKAEQGNASAQFSLALLYLMGEAMPLDYKEAFRWYRASAVQGNSSAQGSLGAMYRKGLGLPQDISKHTCGTASPLQTVNLIRREDCGLETETG